MFRSPIENLKTENIILRVFGLLNIESKSNLLISLYNFYALFTHYGFVYLGFFLQCGSNIFSNSIEESIQILFITIAYMNASFKVYIIASNRNSIEKLWFKFNRVEFKASHTTEFT